MRAGRRISVIIPMLDEEASIGRVIDDIPAWVDQVLVVDNGCTDRSAEVARAHGATVLAEPRRGYGVACLTGMAALDRADVVVFLDADYSDHPEEMGRVVDPVLRGEADLVIGSRVLGRREPGSLTPQSRWGNWLACALIRHVWGGPRCTDLGPFRAVHAGALHRLGMADPNYGWTVEMQAKAARDGLRVVEVPVSYRRRIGRSKVSGTVRGVVLASAKILYTIAFLAAGEPRWARGPTRW